MGLGDLKKPELRGYFARQGPLIIGVGLAAGLITGIAWKIYRDIKNEKIKEYNSKHELEESYEDMRRKGYMQFPKKD